MGELVDLVQRKMEVIETLETLLEKEETEVVGLERRLETLEDQEVMEISAGIAMTRRLCLTRSGEQTG